MAVEIVGRNFPASLPARTPRRRCACCRRPRRRSFSWTSICRTVRASNAPRIKELLPSAQVVMITVYGDDEKVFNALRAGASGYILKRAPPERILQAIREVHAGGVPMSSEIARKVLGAFREPAPAPRRRIRTFTPRTGGAGIALPRLQQQGNRGQTFHQHRDRDLASETHLQQTARALPHPGGVEISQPPEKSLRRPRRLLSPHKTPNLWGLAHPPKRLHY